MLQKNLLSAAESVTNMIKEVELLEERAKQAKKEASNAGKGISEKANELKQTLNHAKEANEMVVYFALLSFWALYLLEEYFDLLLVLAVCGRDLW